MSLEMYNMVENNETEALDKALAADSSDVNKYYRASLLHTATVLHHTEIVKILLKYGARVSDIVKDDRWAHGCYNYNAKEIAMERGFNDILELFKNKSWTFFYAHTDFAGFFVGWFYQRASVSTMADKAVTAQPPQEGEGAEQARKKRTFRKFSYHGVDLDNLLDLTNDQLVELFPARARRRFNRGLKRKSISLVKKLRKAKRNVPVGEKPPTIKTHLRNMIIVPEMIVSVVGVYNGAQFTTVEIKAEMIGHYLGEFSITYKPVKHGKPGIGATHSSRFIPLK